jgi:hypothetical protein
VQDFRARLVKHPPDSTVIPELLAQGQLSKAIRKARALGATIPQEEIDRTATIMLQKHRATELLSLIGNQEVRLPYDAPTLLRAAFKARDYHGFLKQAHRLHVKAGLEKEIQEAIDAVAQGAPLEGASWQRKFSRV